MPYLKVSGDTMNGPLKAQNNANHTTPQARNMVLVAAGEEAPETGDGDVILMYAPMLELITFSIGTGTSCTAEEGMTWSEWVDSEYNTYGYHIASDGCVVDSSDFMCLITSDYNIVSSTDLIIESEVYGTERWI